MQPGDWAEPGAEGTQGLTEGAGTWALISILLLYNGQVLAEEQDRSRHDDTLGLTCLDNWPVTQRPTLSQHLCCLHVHLSFCLSVCLSTQMCTRGGESSSPLIHSLVRSTRCRVGGHSACFPTLYLSASSFLEHLGIGRVAGRWAGGPVNSEQGSNVGKRPGGLPSILDWPSWPKNQQTFARVHRFSSATASHTHSVQTPSSSCRLQRM